MKDATVEELQQRLDFYLKGRLGLGLLTLDRLEEFDRILREENAHNAELLENWGALPEDKAYLLELERFLRNVENGQNGNNSEALRNSLEWSVRLQCYLRVVFRGFRNREENRRTAAERAAQYGHREL